MPDQFVDGDDFRELEVLLPGALAFGEIDAAGRGTQHLIFGIQHLDGQLPRASMRRAVGNGDVEDAVRIRGAGQIGVRSAGPLERFQNGDRSGESYACKEKNLGLHD
jgi:hypothetical protein